MCHKTMERVQCGGCSRWLHLICTKISRSDFHKHIINNVENTFHCSIKCELKLLPFNALDSYDFTKYVSHGKLQYSNQKVSNKKKRLRNKTKSRDKTPLSPLPMCNYIDPDQIANVVNDDCLSDLTVFHGNVRSLRKNLDKLCDIFQNGTKLPDIIGVTETKLKEHLNEIDIDGYDFEHCSSSTEAGGAGIYVANYLEYFVRKDLSLNEETSEDMWVEITTKNTSRGAKYSDLKSYYWYSL